MTRQPKGRIMCSTHEWLDEKPCPYCNNPSASHDSGRTTAMTRQQEGDEATWMVCEYCRWGSMGGKYHGPVCKAKLPATVQPEDETTLPATLEFYVTQEDRDGAREWIGMLTQDIPTLRRGAENCEWNYRAVKRELKTVLDRESSTTARHYDQLESLEAERDALKAEVEKQKWSRVHTQEWYASHYGKLQDWARKILPQPWRRQFFNCVANGTYDHDDLGEPYTCVAGFRVVPSGYIHMDDAKGQLVIDQTRRAEDAESEIADLKAQLDAAVIERDYYRRQADAVVGQETAQDAWTPDLDSIPTYTPPLKAGQ